MWVISRPTGPEAEKERPMPHYMPPPRPPQPPIIHRSPPRPPQAWLNPLPRHPRGSPQNDGCPLLLLVLALWAGTIAMAAMALRTHDKPTGGDRGPLR